MDFDKTKKIWDIERRSDKPERIVFIYNALKKLNLPSNFSILDMAGGRGVVLNGLSGLFPKCQPTIVDIRSYENDWFKFRANIKTIISPLQDFIKSTEQKFDVVMMLNCYRNWSKHAEVKLLVDKWLETHTKYFVTSGCRTTWEQLDITGDDYKSALQLFKIS